MSGVQVQNGTGVFGALLDAALSEVVRRDPRYFDRFHLSLPAIRDRFAEQRRGMAEPDGVDEVLAHGLAHLAERGVRVAEHAEDDPVSRMLCDSMFDAYEAERARLPLDPSAATPRSIVEVVSHDYEERRLASGCRYCVRAAGQRPLVLINAVGIPLAMWARFLGDRSHQFRVLIVESGSADLLSGEMHGHTSIGTDTADIAEAMSRAAMERADVLAWCNGGRVAVDLATRHPDRVGSVVLLSPTMMGTEGMRHRPSLFEESLDKVFDTVVRQPEFAPFFSETLRQPPAIDWEQLSGGAYARAAALFRSPAREHASALLAPVSAGPSLIHYSCRGKADIAYPMADALRRFDARTLLITGDCDDVVNNALTLAAFALRPRPAVCASVSGAGHYVHDLQYAYFRWLLQAFLVDARTPCSTARVAVSAVPAGGAS